MSLKFSPLFVTGRHLRYHNGLRKMLALGLVLIVFLPTLVFSVSAYAAINDSSDNDHFILYQDQNGDTVCREATALEAQELDKINPTELRPINHLDAISKKGGVRAEDLPQHLTIILRATPNLEANAPAKAAFIRAAQAWENVISSPVTLYIDADVGPDNFGSAWESGVLGATSTPSLNGVNYPTLRATLNAVANTPAKQAVYNALPQSSVPIDAGSGSATAVSVSTSIARAIGLADPTAQPSDSAARIGFNSAVNFDFDSSNGVVGTDFQSVATHEIGHALGFTSRSGSSGNSTPAMWDLYRFRSGTTAASFATAQRIMTVGGPTTNSQYYFVPGINEIGLSDGGSTPPAQPPFPNNSDGNQSSHWRQASLNGGVFTGYIGIMDPRLPGGITRPITANDTDALGIFGYNANLVVPPPPANDNFANAQTLAGCSGTVTGTNVSATKESGELNHLSTTTDPTGGGSRSVWYQWQAPASGSVTFDTSGSGIDTVLGIYTGNAVNSLAVIGQDDDVVNGTVRTSTITFNATAGTTYKIAVDGYNNGGSGGEVGPIKLNWTASNCIAQLIQISQFFAVNESAAFVTIVITRSGDTAGPASVNYATSDSAGLVSCGVNSGVASERCDYATTVGTAQFAAGVNTASITIPIVHDALVEGDENFTLSLSSPTGGTLASPPTATITIVDNDFAPATQNPFDDIPFFVTQQYIDFLGRLPDATGFNNWVGTLNGCPNGGFGEFDNPGCDRVHVSAGFFLSAEFQGRGYFAYRFYEVALDRRPTYGEFVPDMALVGGPQSPESEVLSKATYTDAWMQRSQFKSRYDALSNSDYVNALEANAEIVVSNKQSLIDALNGGSMNRGQVLRNIVESQAVANQFFNRAFVSMQYFGYLRRDPDTIGFQNWLNTLNADPSNFRHMIFGFLYSTEYRQRFGP